MLGVHTAHAQDSVITQADYFALLERMRTAVDTARTTGDTTPLFTAAADLSTVTEVELTDGTRVPVDTSHLVTLSTQPDPPLDYLADTIDLILGNPVTPDQPLEQSAPNGDASDAPRLPQLGESAPPPPLDEADEERDQILSRAEFQYRERPFWENLRDAFDRLLAALNNVSNPLGEATRYILFLIGLIIVVLASVFALRRLLASVVSDTTAADDYDSEIEMLTSQTALDRARETSEEGDYRSAVRYLYLSTLLLLEERDLLRYDRARTNMEYIRSLRERPELAATLSDVVDVFDRVWYGFQTIDETTFSQYAERVAELQRQQ